MLPRQVTDNVQWVGAVDWDRRLFDELIPLPDGTSYNAYLVQGAEKTVLFDSVDPPFTPTLMERLAAAGAARIDYVVCHHGEQDHSGSIPAVLERHPEATVLATEKCKAMLQELLHIAPERIRAVADGERVDLGGLTLEFIHFPWVHWPETMVTWLPERRTLFTCDLFGSHLATSDLFAGTDAASLLGAKRYYAEIMMPFRTIIARQMPRLADLDIAFIAPSHGPVYDRPGFIVDAYRHWLSAPPENLVVVPFISMHDSTRRMVERFVESAANCGMRVEQFNLAEPDIGRLAMLLVDAATLVIGSPMVLGGPHPKVAYAAMLANLIRPKVRFLSVLGSFGWGGRLVDQLKALVPNLKVELLEPVLVRGLPRAEDLVAVDRLARAIAEKHLTIGHEPAGC